MGKYLPVVNFGDQMMRTSAWGYPSGGPAAAIWPTANMIYYYPFTVLDSFTCVAGVIPQSAAGVASLGRVGVYSSSAGEPVSKLGETNGTIDLTTAGANATRRTAFTANVTLAAGTIYFAAITVNTGGAWTGFAYNPGAGPVDVLDMHGARQEAGSGTLPTTATPADYAPASEVVWHFSLTQSTAVPVAT